MVPSQITLQNGEVFQGVSPNWQEGYFFGEVVFTTGMTGYVECLTDPSFFGQLLTFTYPLIGNYGVPERAYFESSKAHVSGVILSQLSSSFAHYKACTSLLDFLKNQKIPLIAEVDTRALTLLLRKQGTCIGAIGPRVTPPSLFPLPVEDHVKHVSTQKIEIYSKGPKRVILVDCGMKENILRSLLQFPIEVCRVPFDYDYTTGELANTWDAVFLSNGPGDPISCIETIAILRKALSYKKPIFGVCLGVQLLCHAVGGKTYKLPYGHRGHNQPCQEQSTGKCFLTSQNHGFAVDETTLPTDWRVSFRNLNDQSVEGIQHLSLPYSAVQFHPEAAPGPVDTQWLFKRFYETL